MMDIKYVSAERQKSIQNQLVNLNIILRVNIRAISGGVGTGSNKT